MDEIIVKLNVKRARDQTHTLALAHPIEFGRDPCRLLAVALHNVEMAQDGKADFHKKLEAEERKYRKVNIGQLLSKRSAFFYQRHCCTGICGLFGEIQVSAVPGSRPGAPGQLVLRKEDTSWY